MSRIFVCAALLLAIGCVKQQAQEPSAKAAPHFAQAKAEPDTAAARDAQFVKAWKYLQSMYGVMGGPDKQLMDAGWGPKSGMIAYTALVLQGIHGSNVWDDNNAMIKDSVAFIADNQDATGCWHLFPLSYIDGELGAGMRGQRAVYTTAIVAALFADLDKAGAWKGKLTQKVALARDYLKQSQVGNPNGAAKDYKKDNVGYGGWAYSKEEIATAVNQNKKPAANMSTSAFAIDALHACGVAETDPLFQDALTFLKRNQNAGEVQSDGFVAKTKDGKTIKMAGPDSQDYGGAIYSEETSKVEGRVENADGTVTLFSYGTMTYNLLRAYLFAGLKKDSLPVKLAMGWIRKNWVMDKVPGYREKAQFDQGLYYYYFSMARSLKVLGEDTMEDDRGFKHDWRAELVGQLGKLQKEDGSWVNSNVEFQEGAPMIATSFALDALRNSRK
jgi:hypothetical protein